MQELPAEQKYNHASWPPGHATRVYYKDNLEFNGGRFTVQREQRDQEFGEDTIVSTLLDDTKEEYLQ